MSDMKEVICTCCPQGCHLQVDEVNDYKVTGSGRTGQLALAGNKVHQIVHLHSRCPVKTSKPVPKGQMAEVVAAAED